MEELHSNIRSSKRRRKKGKRRDKKLEHKITRLKNEFDLQDLQDDILDLVENNRNMAEFEIADKIRYITAGVRSNVTHLVVNLSSMINENIRSVREESESKNRVLEQNVSKLKNKVEFQKQENIFLEKRNQNLDKRLKYVRKEVKRLRQKSDNNEKRVIRFCQQSIDTDLLRRFKNRIDDDEYEDEEVTSDDDEEESEDYEEEDGDMYEDDEANDFELMNNGNSPRSRSRWNQTMRENIRRSAQRRPRNSRRSRTKNDSSPNEVKKRRRR